MKPLAMLFLIAATAAAAPITAVFVCETSGSSISADGAISASFVNGDAGCWITLSPSNIHLGVSPNNGTGRINWFLITASREVGFISGLGAFFVLDPLGDRARGYFQVFRNTSVHPFASEEVFYLDVFGTYANIPQPGNNRRIELFLDTEFIPEPSTWALYSIGLIGVAGWRRWGRSGRAQRSS